MKKKNSPNQMDCSTPLSKYLCHLKNIETMTHSSNNAIPSIPDGVKLVTLENGLTIITREDHSAPVVSAQAWAMTGSIHEEIGRAHV